MSFSVPFSFEERKPYLGEGFFYVPPHYKEHDPSVFPLDSFSLNRRIFLELCSGNGEWIYSKAKQYPHIFWIAVEKRFDRAKKIWKKGKALDNLFVILGEGLTFLQHYLPDQSLSRIFVNFPDPWPKVKHAKHRLLDLPLKQELERLLPPTHLATIVTDDADYRNHVIDLFSSNWRAEFPFPNYSVHWEGYGSSFFRNLWESKDKNSYFLSFSYRGRDG